MLGLQKLREDLILLSHVADVEWALRVEEVGNVTALSRASWQIHCWRWAVSLARRTFGTGEG